jgi:hypothetical protein
VEYVLKVVPLFISAAEALIVKSPPTGATTADSTCVVVCALALPGARTVINTARTTSHRPKKPTCSLLESTLTDITIPDAIISSRA